MPFDTPCACRAILAAGSGLVLLAAAATGDARAQARLEAGYTLSAARIPIGDVTATADIGDADYTISATGRASGVLRVLASGDGSLTAHGNLKDGRLQPTSFTSRTTNEEETADVKMTIEDGNVKELIATEPPPSPDRTAVTEAQRRGIVDPLSAILIPAGDSGDGLSERACERTLAIFDGRRRYDLKLAFKRMDKVKADKGYAGPAVVCAITLQPVAGHRPSSTLVKYLSEGREIDVALAPIAGTRMLAPFRLAVISMLGNLVLQAYRFESLARPSARAAAEAGANQ